MFSSVPVVVRSRTSHKLSRCCSRNILVAVKQQRKSDKREANNTEMFVFLREHGSWIAALSAGIVVGASTSLLINRHSRIVREELDRLARTVDELREDVRELRELLDNKKFSGYYSVHASSASGDEDEIYEEANEGSDLDASFSRSRSLNGPSTSKGEFPRIGSHDSFSAEQFFSKVDSLFEGSDREKEKAFNLLKEKHAMLSNDPEFLWRFAKAKHLLSDIEGAKGRSEIKRALIMESKDLAYKALALDENNPDVQKWCAITLGNSNDYVTVNEKIANGFRFKEHIQNAIRIRASDPTSFYLLGRWCHGVYMMTWLERKAAAMLFSEPPSSTIEEALDNFLQAENLNPGKWKENMLYIGKCYIEMRDYNTAVDWLNRAKILPNNGPDDRAAHAEIDTLLYKYSGYAT